MTLKSSHWIFYNEANADEQIIVHDQASADLLTEVLKSHAAVWMVQEVARAKPSAAAQVPPPLKAAPRTQEEVPALRVGDERRTQKRFDAEFRIVLICEDRSFRSISKDISLGGMKLKKAVPPEFAGKKCVAYISNSNSIENIEMVCEVIADPKDARRMQFSEPNADQLKRLNAWLNSIQPLQHAG